MKHIISPELIHAVIDQTVIGQDQAKKVISMAMFMHFARTAFLAKSKKPFKKSNPLLLGPSGNGKTLLVRAASKAVRELSGYGIAPILEVDCTGLTSKGWAGDDLSDLLQSHYRKHFKQRAAFDSTVVFLDEIDKLCMPQVGKGGTDHNRATQYGLLKAVEGMKITLEGDIDIDTGGMMFVFAGNFPQIRHNLAKRDKLSMGFGATDVAKKKKVDVHQQLEEGGMITQLVGRISTVGRLDKLTKKELRQILVGHVIPEYKDLIDFLNHDLTISDYHLRKIVEEAYDKGTGARGLQAAVDAHIQKMMYHVSIECLQED